MLTSNPHHWLLALTSFSLIRREAPIFALAFLGLAISQTDFSLKEIRKFVFPHLLFLTIWSGITLYFAYILDFPYDATSRVIILVGYLFFTGTMLFMQQVYPLVSWFYNNFVFLLVGGMTLGFIGAFALKPRLMIGSLDVLIHHMTRTWYWGGTWYILIGLIAMLALKEKTEEDLIFLVTLPIYILITQIGNFARGGAGHFDVWDSVNRLLLSIVPLIYFAAAIQIRNISLKPKNRPSPVKRKQAL